MKLDGKVALIDGAASGMGLAGARLFAREGAKVALADINDDAGTLAVQEIRKQGGEAYYVHADSGKVADVKNMIETTVKKYGKLDIFWHNAGIPGPVGIEGVSEEAFAKIIDIHLKGGFFGAQYAIPELRKAGGGSILFTSSVSGIKATSPSAAYTCAKAALVHLTRWLAARYAKDNIRVNCICPGLIETGMTEITKRDLTKSGKSFEEWAKGMLTATPMNRFGKPGDIAAAALFLVSDDASFITGDIMSVDGGNYVYAGPVL